jgi:hypothetical protein
MLRLRRRRLTFFVVFGVLVPLGACGTSAIGVDICNEIESARCTRAANIDGGCGIDFMAPFEDAPASSSTPSENAATCIRFYSIACLHGLVTPDLPPAANVNDCVDAIANGSCAVVLNPADASASCTWLAEGGTDAGEGGTTEDAPNGYTIGGAVTGLDVDAGASLMLQDNGGDNLTIAADGTFVFPTALTTGSSYLVTIATPPLTQTCTLTNASGTVATANITNILVTCASLGSP